MRWLRWLAMSALMLSSGLVAAQASTERVIDDFSDRSRWTASASDQVQARIAPDAAGAMCLHYDFGRVSGYAVARRVLALELPPYHGFTLRLYGQGEANAFQVKFIDASGDNVWWRNLPDFTPPAQPMTLKIRQRQIDFAWGPTEDKLLKRAAAIELVVASGQGGGAGRLCFERLTLLTLAPPGPAPSPVLRQSAEGSTLDLGAVRELNGLLWRWGEGQPAPAQVTVSDDGRQWRTLHPLPKGQRSLQALWLPEQEARYLRISGPRRVAEMSAPSPQDWPDRNAMLTALAAQAPRSHYPRAFHGEQNYWTLVGVDGGGANAALLSEDGAIEPHRGGPSIQPMVTDGQGRLLGWAEVQAQGRSSTTLREGHLPLPSVHWRHPAFGLQVEAGAEGGRDQAQLIARYTLHNPTTQRQTLTLSLLLRPWQVNPPQQFLNTAGGVAPMRFLAWSGGALQVDGRPWLKPMAKPDRVLATAFDAGDGLGAGATPLPLPLPLHTLRDPQGLPSARLDWAMDLAPGERRSVSVVLPLAGQLAALVDEADAAARLDQLATAWRLRLNRVGFTLPPQAQPLHDSLRVALSHILMSRDGPALQPGTRSYARSWIRDGAMMVAGLLRLGEIDAAREFTSWYAGQLFANGKVPCCVDARGADPVAENDSHGQFIFSVAELWRHTHDQALVASLWPQVDAAARYMETLRQSERSAANREPGREAFWGLMPASISHEGYSAKPMHSYWDNFWALAGWRDAVLLARAGGHAARADELQAQHDEFRRELGQSLAATMAQHRIPHLPGAAELGDFDPTSSTLVFSPAGAEDLVPPAALEATWQRYWNEAQQRQRSSDWAEYTPYELRSVSALLRLGQPERALAMLDFFHADQRPAGWHQWAEVVDRRPRHARFIGDMPHAWISSDYIRSALDLLAYERDRDQALILAAGVPLHWLASGPVGVQGLRTAWGPLGYTLAQQGQGVVLSLSPGLVEPPGGLWLHWLGQLHRVPAGLRQLALPAQAAAQPAR